MRPEPIEISATEGEAFVPFVKAIDRKSWRYNPAAVHAIKFSDGSIFDTVNGWRRPPGSDWSFPKPRFRVPMGRALA